MISPRGGLGRGSLSDPADNITGMSPTVLDRRSVEAANEAIRRYVAGRRTWSRAELAELDRLRAIWQAARQGHGRGRTQGRKGEE